MRIAKAVGVWVVLCGVAGGVGHADDAPANWHLSPGASCLTLETLEPRVEHWLGRALPPKGAAAQLRVVGSPDDPRSVAVEVWVGDNRQAARTFAPGPPRCEDLVEAVALTAAMMLQSVEETAWLAMTEAEPEKEPEGADAPSPPEFQPNAPAEEVPTALPVTTPPPAESAPEPKGPPRPAAVARLGVGLLARPAANGSGVGGRMELGVQLGFRGGLRVAFAALAFPGRPLAGVDSGYVSQQLTGRLEACVGSPHARQFRVAACLGGGGGRLRVKGRDVARVERARTALPVIHGGLELPLRIRPRLELAGRMMLEKAIRSIRVAATDGEGRRIGETPVPSFGVNFGLMLRHAFVAKRTGD